ncbi:hypothetical protein SK128_005215 [Halocaridina rubra]|uniref:Uncharacterized protein n=1 Tax=Halocaridina rubra TaxID=373956 RepID=A0AAN8ZNS3_HALRR
MGRSSLSQTISPIFLHLKLSGILQVRSSLGVDGRRTRGRNAKVKEIMWRQRPPTCLPNLPAACGRTTTTTAPRNASPSSSSSSSASDSSPTSDNLSTYIHSLALTAI